MIILRTKIFSTKQDIMIKNITSRLDREGLEDYEVSSKIPNDVISINSDLSNIIIYIPVDYEYSQYEIDSYVRSIAPFVRTDTKLDRNIFVMKLSGKLTEAQYYKLIKEIILEEEFCTIINDEED